jgi:gamma-glutamyltranspeptidase
MLQTTTATRGIVTAPHHLAAEAGIDVLRDGGNAIEAMVAAAATVAVVYPHMNGIGGDGFWLIHVPGRSPVGIDACGATGTRVEAELYRSQGYDSVPPRGPLAANTVAGTLSGWGEALKLSAELGGLMPLSRLLEAAIHYADAGVPVTGGQNRLSREKLPELADVPGFANTFLTEGKPPDPGVIFRQPRLAETFRRVADRGPDDFYRGALARDIAADLARAASPISAEDLAAHRAKRVAPLRLAHATGTVYNMPPPTQGLASLMLLGIFERLGVDEADGFAYVHGQVESAKQAFLVRDKSVTDPNYLTVLPEAFLRAEALSAAAAAIHPAKALDWPSAEAGGDTVWMGAVDAAGLAVSFIQSIFWEFGSGVVLESTGIQWQNRGSSFRLDENALNRLEPARKPFHTLNPALSHLNDGRVMAYGTMGGEGQPQTQGAIYSRYAVYGQGLQVSVTAPRWLLGRTWGAETSTLKLESRFDQSIVESLAAAGHEVEMVAPFSDLMGHAGAVVHHPDGLIEGAADPRSDGRAAAW